MRRRAALGVLVLLLLAAGLTGCAGGPESRESAAAAVVSVLGVEQGGSGLRLWAAAEGRGQAGPFHAAGQGATPAAAVEDLTAQGGRVVSTDHVEHLLLAQGAAEALPALLRYAFQEPRQSTETQLWLVRTDALEPVFAREGDVAQAMTVWKDQGARRQGFAPLTLRQAAAALAQGEALLLPTLAQGEALLLPTLAPGEEGLVFAGFALYQEGEITQWLTGQAALGAALLSGEKITWTASLEEGAVTLRSLGCQAKPVWEGETLTGLTLRCRLEGVPAGAAEDPDPALLETAAAQAMETALDQLQAAGADGAGLLGRAGLANPLRWGALRGQWERAFPSLSITCQVTAAVTPGG